VRKNPKNIQEDTVSAKDISICVDDTHPVIGYDGKVNEIAEINFCWVSGVMMIVTKDGNMDNIHYMEISPKKQHLTALRDYLNFCLLDFNK